MIPTRFISEYPERCLNLITMMEPKARKADLLGSFALLAAASVFTIPYERAKVHHMLARPTDDAPLYQALRVLEQEPFLSSELWGNEDAGEWNYLRVKHSSEHTWVNFPSMTPIGEMLDDTMKERSNNQVLRVTSEMRSLMGT